MLDFATFLSLSLSLSLVQFYAKSVKRFAVGTDKTSSRELSIGRLTGVDKTRIAGLDSMVCGAALRYL